MTAERIADCFATLAQYVKDNPGLLRAVRVHWGAKQTTVAHLADVPREYVSRIENGCTGLLPVRALKRLLETYEHLPKLLQTGQLNYDWQVRRKCRRAAKVAIGRCYDPENPQYRFYGGRGVQVHGPWIANPHAFVTYLMTLPGCDNFDLMLDRIDNGGHYEPCNLHFVTRRESALNKSPSLVRKRLRTYVRLYGKRLVEARGRRTQQDIADAARVPLLCVQLAEVGEPHGNSKKLLRMLDAYGVNYFQDFS